ncbi:MAG: transposase [Firmicutes bacterium]|nr:transposase [Bacillota bacterium]
MAEYVQLAHNQRDPKTGVPRAVVLYNFGRMDQLDLEALRRLVKSISRFLEPQEVEVIKEQLGEESPFEFLGSRQIGGSWLLDGMWKRLGIEKTLRQLLSDRDFRTPVERMLFAMVANRALAPASKLQVEHWVAREALIDQLPGVDVHQLYRAMDFLIEAADEIQKQVFFSVASLLNLEVDLLFLDTTTTYFEIKGEDEDHWDQNHWDQKGLRKRGYGKDNHPELARVVIAFAVTRDGIPVRCWVWPGNTADENIVEQVKTDLNGSHQVYGRYVRQTKTGKLVLNHAKIRAEEHLDGKYLVSTSDGKLPAKDVVLGYKQLAVIERVFKDLKHLVDIRPVYHRLEERIRAHVLLCWLAMLLIRVAENETGQTWHEMKKALATLQVGIHRTRSGEIWQTNMADTEQQKLFETLKLKPPPRYYSVSPLTRGTV